MIIAVETVQTSPGSLAEMDTIILPVVLGFGSYVWITGPGFMLRSSYALKHLHSTTYSCRVELTVNWHGELLSLGAWESNLRGLLNIRMDGVLYTDYIMASLVYHPQ